MNMLNGGRKNSEMISVYYKAEYIGLFKAEFGSGYQILDLDEDTILIRFPLTNTWFAAQIQEVGWYMHWHILDGNCRQLPDADTKLTLKECADFIKRHRFGNALDSYYSYA